MSGITSLSPWLTFGSVVAASGAFALVGYLWRHRGKPGADWFVATLAAQGVFCLASAASLLAVPRAVALALEVVTWVTLFWTGPLFVAFALAYTGRGGLLEGFTAVSLAVTTTLSTTLVATAPVHELVWRGLRFDSTATPVVSYTVGPWGYLVVGIGLSLAAVGVLLLVETVLSYGPLYRREAVAVALSTLSPAVATVVWLAGVGPVTHHSIVAVAFVPHVLLDGYAFVESGMFETNPTTRRMADKTAIDDIGTPVLVLDPDDRVVDYNSAAGPLLDVDGDGTTLRGRSVSALVDFDSRRLSDGGLSAADQDAADRQSRSESPATADGDAEIADEVVTVRSGGRRREFLVSRSMLTEPGGTRVGTTMVFQDVTRERRREQRLDVLNRVLRHNLRNKMTAIAGNATLIRERVDDDAVAKMASTIDDSARDLIDISEKARRFERCRQRGPRYQSVPLDERLEDVVAEHSTDDGTVALSVDDATATTDPELFALVVSNLVENALEHGGDTAVSVSATVDDGEIRVTVSDDGPGIPESELAPLRAGSESQLQHSAGIGLWVVEWTVSSLGGTVSFDTENGTTVTVRLPDGEDAVVRRGDGVSG